MVEWGSLSNMYVNKLQINTHINNAISKEVTIAPITTDLMKKVTCDLIEFGNSLTEYESEKYHIEYMHKFLPKGYKIVKDTDEK